MANAPLDTFDPTCKDDGAKWYACPATSSNRSPFVGCCKTDPCTISGCAVGNLAPASFNASAYGTMPDPSCGAASTFHSCVNIPKNDTTFWGCCKTDACSAEGMKCPKGDLTAAVLDTASLQQAYSKDGKAQSEDADTDAAGHSHTGVIVGSAVGGGVAIVAIIAILVYCLFKKRRGKSRRGSSSSSTAYAAFPAPEKTEYRHSAISEAPPMYNSPSPTPSPASFAGFPGASSKHHYTQVAQSSADHLHPQELPGDFTPAVPNSLSSPSASAANMQRYSELPAEYAAPVAPVELESPMVGAHMGSPGRRAVAGEERLGGRGEGVGLGVEMGGGGGGRPGFGPVR